MALYYGLPFAQAALQARLAAVARATPPRATVLDIGCNDATMARDLLRSGHARRVIGIDRSPLCPPPTDGFEFIRADVRNLRLADLGPFDLVLALNVLHHLVDESVRAAREVVHDILDNTHDALIDMGSFTEVGGWTWRRTIARHWTNDESMWNDLFAGAPRVPVLRYPAMGGGYRVMWRIAGRRTM